MKDLNEVKNKSIIIDGDLHTQFKLFCRGKSLKIGGLIEGLIKLYLARPKEIQKMIDEVNTENE